MEDRKTYRTPGKTLAMMQVVRFGKILFNMQFIAVAVMVASVLSFIIPAIYYIFLIAVLLLSLFTLLTDPGFMAMLSGGETLIQITEVLSQSWKYTVPIVAVMSLASIVCLCLDKYTKHTARIVVASIMCVLSVLVLLLKLISTGGV